MTKTRRSLLFPTALFVLCLCFQKACMEGVARGLKLVLHTALPALFPFLVLSRLITGSLLENDRRAARFLPLFLGFLCGFPIGAKSCAELYEKGAISRERAERLLFCCNNTGPAFLIGVCGIGALGNAKYGVILYFFQVFFALILYLLFPLLRKEKKEREKVPFQARKNDEKRTFFALLSESIGDGLTSFLYLSSFILFFSFCSSLLFALIPGAESGIGGAVSLLFLELTGGIAKLKEFPFSTAFPLAAAGIGWAGVSVHMQTIGLLKKAQLPCRGYLLGKALLAVLMLLTAEILKKYL